MIEQIGEYFRQLGGTFFAAEQSIAAELAHVRAFVFDWDGVFNNGIKNTHTGSPFSEADSMGLNMLRFDYWRRHGQMPIVIILTGANNLTAVEFANREHLDGVFLNYSDKKRALDRFAERTGLAFSEMVFILDDILDLSAARHCRLAFAVRRRASPLFTAYIRDSNICHYLSACEGGEHAVREITELMIGLGGDYRATIEARIDYGEEYRTYLALRKAIVPVIEAMEK